MSDTPETNAFFDHAISTKSKYPEYCAPFEGFCQKLERDEARGEQCFIQCAFEESQDKIEELERERDEAIIKYTGEANEFERQRNQAIAECEEAIRERDEAREALRELWQTADAYIPQIDEEQATKWHHAMFGNSKNG
jgi:uncharacterized coiled-coil DUF342 family protein